MNTSSSISHPSTIGALLWPATSFSDDWPGDMESDPAYLQWLEEQADISAMRTAALWDSARPGLSLVGSHAFAP
jgi:hypothetical protein